MLAEAFSILRCSVFVETARNKMQEHIHFSPASLLSSSVWLSILVRYRGDTAREKKLHVCSCMQVIWVPLQRKGEFGVLSACSGGKVLLWTVDSDPGSLVLSAAYALVQQQIPHSSSVKVSRKMTDDTESNVIEISTRYPPKLSCSHFNYPDK